MIQLLVPLPKTRYGSEDYSDSKTKQYISCLLNAEDIGQLV